MRLPSIEAVIADVLQDGSGSPVAFASCTLTSSERNCAQTEKEALSLHDIWSSCLPLQSILGSHHGS